MYLAKLFSGFTHNMCKVVTDFSVESYKVHEACIKVCIFMQQRCSFAAFFCGKKFILYNSLWTCNYELKLYPKKL